MNQAIAEKAVNRILESLSNGTVPWENPWLITGGAKSHVTGRSYSLLNQMSLGSCGEWLTFAQAKKEGGKVKKGAKGRSIVFWKVFAETIEGDDGEAVSTGRTIPYLKYYTVFNVDDVEGVEAKHQDEPLPDGAQRVEEADAAIEDYIARSGIKTRRDELSPEAYYMPALDLVRLPKREQFYNTQGYYNTVFHELAHSTGSDNRLKRPQGKQGTKQYAAEELVAEITASALLAHFGLLTERQAEQNAAYCDSWHKRIQDDPGAFVVAAGRAQKAIDLILNIERETETTTA